MKVKLSKSQWEEMGKKAGWFGPEPKKCNCGSGEIQEPEYDARGIFLTYACPKCRKEKLSRFKIEVLEDPNYESNEPIEEASVKKTIKTAMNLNDLDISTEEKANRIIITIIKGLDQLLKNAPDGINMLSIERKISGKGTDQEIEDRIKRKCIDLLLTSAIITRKYPALHNEFRDDFLRIASLFENKFYPKTNIEMPTDNIGDNSADKIEELKNKALDDFSSGKISKERLNSIMTELVASVIKGIKKISYNTSNTYNLKLERAKKVLKIAFMPIYKVEAFINGKWEKYPTTMSTGQNAYKYFINKFRNGKYNIGDEENYEGKKWRMVLDKDGMHSIYNRKNKEMAMAKKVLAFDEKMMPGQTPYTQEEKRIRDQLVGDAAKAEEIIGIDELDQVSLKDEMMNFLREKYKGLIENIDESAEVAIYWFANHYHGGQTSELYSILSTSPFRTGPFSKLENEDEVVKMMYEDLSSVKNFQR